MALFHARVFSHDLQAIRTSAKQYAVRSAGLFEQRALDRRMLILAQAEGNAVRGVPCPHHVLLRHNLEADHDSRRRAAARVHRVRALTPGADRFRLFGPKHGGFGDWRSGRSDHDFGIVELCIPSLEPGPADTRNFPRVEWPGLQ